MLTSARADPVTLDLNVDLALPPQRGGISPDEPTPFVTVSDSDSDSESDHDDDNRDRDFEFHLDDGDGDERAPSGRPNARYSRAEDRTLQRLLERGMKRVDVAEHMNRSYASVSNRMSILGLVRRSSGGARQRSRSAASSRAPAEDRSMSSSSAAPSTRKTCKSWSAEDLDRLVKLFEQGVAVKDCALQLNRSYEATIQRLHKLRKAGRVGDGAQPPHISWSAEQDRRLVEMSDIMSRTDIAAAFDCSERAVYRRLARLRGRAEPSASPSASLTGSSTMATVSPPDALALSGSSSSAPQRASMLHLCLGNADELGVDTY